MNTYTATPILENLDNQPDSMELEALPSELGRMTHFSLTSTTKRNFCLRSYTDNPYGVSKSRRLYGEYGK